jgi:dTMP kinase
LKVVDGSQIVCCDQYRVTPTEHPMIIALEGIDACGKATQSRRLADRLKAKLIVFPNDATPVGNLLSGLLFDDSVRDAQREAPTDPLLIQALHFVNKMESVDAILEGGRLDSSGFYQHVVLDRYWMSSYAYGVAESIDPAWLLSLNRHLPQPDLAILIDVDEADSLARRPQRRDMFEARPDFLPRVAEHYRELWAARMGERGYGWRVVDGRQPVDAVEQAIFAAVEEWRDRQDRRLLASRPQVPALDVR